MVLFDFLLHLFEIAVMLEVFCFDQAISLAYNNFAGIVVYCDLCNAKN